jgi:hypothetical protein
MLSWTIVGIVAVVFVFYKFINALGKHIPILELMLLIAGMQWILGAAIEYQTSFHHFKYYMYVDELEYMSYVVPAYIAFVVLIFYGLKKVKLKIDVDLFSAYSKFGIALIIIGIASDIVRPSAPGGLQFILFLLANFKYVGAIILFFSKQKWHQILFYIAIVSLAAGSLASGFFHEFIIWSTFFYMFWCCKKKPNVKFSVLIIILGFFLSTIIQAVKMDYREYLKNGFEGSYSSLFIDILNKRLAGGLAEDAEEQSELNVRLNQGWIISAIMDHTPAIEQHAQGQTIKEAVFASALPRFLNPNKKEASGRENFEKFTGITLGENTSMGISVVGESYANFGRLWGIFFMAIYGFLIIKIWSYLNNRIQKDLVIIFFLPLIFLQVIKAESELLTVLNHLVKAVILVFAFLYFIKKFNNFNGRLSNAD